MAYTTMSHKGTSERYLIHMITCVIALTSLSFNSPCSFSISSSFSFMKSTCPSFAILSCASTLAHSCFKKKKMRHAVQWQKFFVQEHFKKLLFFLYVDSCELLHLFAENQFYVWHQITPWHAFHSPYSNHLAPSTQGIIIMHKQDCTTSTLS